MTDTLAVPGERERLRALHELALLDTPPEERFDRITRTARRALSAPIALVTLVDADRQWAKSCAGLGVRQIPRAHSFCAHAIASSRPLIVRDALADPRFGDSPLVRGAPGIRFYAGQPLTVAGARVGTLCVIDTEPRDPAPEELEALVDLAAWAETELTSGDLGRALEHGRELERLKDGFLGLVAHELRTPLTAIAGYSDALLDGEAGALAPEQADYVETVARNAARLAGVLDDLLLVARLETGSATVEPRRVDVVALAREVVARRGDAARGRGVELALDAPSDEIAAGLDRERVLLVLDRLVDAAVAAASEGDAVVVRVVDADGRVAVAVAGAPTLAVQLAGAGRGVLRAAARGTFTRPAAAVALAAEVAARHGGALVAHGPDAIALELRR